MTDSKVKRALYKILNAMKPEEHRVYKAEPGMEPTALEDDGFIYEVAFTDQTTIEFLYVSLKAGQPGDGLSAAQREVRADEWKAKFVHLPFPCLLLALNPDTLEMRVTPVDNQYAA